jgi:hypothetical protein
MLYKLYFILFEHVSVLFSTPFRQRYRMTKHLYVEPFNRLNKILPGLLNLKYLRMYAFAKMKTIVLTYVPLSGSQKNCKIRASTPGIWGGGEKCCEYANKR